MKTKYIIPIIALFFISCKTLFLASYDKSIEDGLTEISKQINILYDNMYYKVSSNKFTNNAKDYIKIAADINGVLLKSKLKAKNENFIKTVYQIDSLWKVYIQQHQHLDSLSSLQIMAEKNGMNDFFETAIKSENFKK